MYESKNDIIFLLDKFNEQILKGEYYDAHETLELFWFPRRKLRDDETLFVKGLINASVSFELKRKNRGNPNKIWQVYLKYKPLFFNLDVTYKSSYKNTMDILEKKAKQKNIM